jgi:hypothetical protein
VLVTNWDLRARVLSIAPPDESDEQQARRRARSTEYRAAIAEVQLMVRDAYTAASLREIAISEDHSAGVTKGDRARAAEKAKFYTDIAEEGLLPLFRHSTIICKRALLNSQMSHLACRPLNQRIHFWKTKLVTPDGFASFFRLISGTVDIRQVTCILNRCIVLTIRYRAMADVPGLRGIWKWRLPITCDIIHKSIHVPRQLAYTARHQHPLLAIRTGVEDDIRTAEATMAIRKLDDSVQASRYPSWRDVPVLLVRGHNNTEPLSQNMPPPAAGPEEEGSTPVFG